MSNDTSTLAVEIMEKLCSHFRKKIKCEKESNWALSLADIIVYEQDIKNDYLYILWETKLKDPRILKTEFRYTFAVANDRDGLLFIKGKGRDGVALCLVRVEPGCDVNAVVFEMVIRAVEVIKMDVIKAIRSATCDVTEKDVVSFADNVEERVKQIMTLISEKEEELFALYDDLYQAARKTYGFYNWTNLKAVSNARFVHTLILDERAGTINVVLGPICMAGCDMGYYLVQISTAVSDNIPTTKICKVPYREVDGYYHPHISPSGKPCWGEYHAFLRTAAETHDLFLYVVTIFDFLCNYNPNDAYRALGEIAEEIGEIVNPQELEEYEENYNNEQ